MKKIKLDTDLMPQTIAGELKPQEKREALNV